MDATLQQVLEATGAKTQDLVCLKLSDTPGIALATLKKHNITSAPVVNDKGIHVGIIDVFTIAKHLVEDWLPQSATGLAQRAFETADKFLDSGDLDSLLSRDAHLKLGGAALSQHLIDSLKRDFISPKYGRFVHRIVLVSTTGEPYCTLSQSDIVKFFHIKPRILGLKMYYSLEQMGLGGQGVFSVSENTPTFKVLRDCVEHHVLAVPVTDNDGKVVASFSVSDLRTFDREDLNLLELPVLDYLRRRNPITLHTVTEADTLAHVVGLLVQHKVHRVWMVNAKGQPVGVVSLKDVLAAAILLGTDEAGALMTTYEEANKPFQLNPAAAAFVPKKQELTTVTLKQALAELKDRPHTHLHTVGRRTSLQDALDLMKKYHVQSLPIVTEPEYILGCVDALSILRCLASKVVLQAGGGLQLSHQQAEEVMATAVENGATMDFDMVWPAMQNESLADALKALTNYSGHKTVHRLVIVDELGAPTDIFSQHDALLFLLQHQEFMGLDGAKTVEQLGWGDKPVVCIGEQDSAIQAFSVLVNKHVSSVAILGKDNKLAGALSAFDICFHPSVISMLHESVMEWKQKLTPQQEMHTITKDTPLREVVNKFCTSRVHHLFVTDSSNTVLSIVTPTDVVRLMDGGHK